MWLKEKLPKFYCDGNNIFVMKHYVDSFHFFVSVAKKFVKTIDLKQDYSDIDLNYLLEDYEYRKRKTRESISTKENTDLILRIIFDFYTKKDDEFLEFDAPLFLLKQNKFSFFNCRANNTTIFLFA